MSPVEPEVRKRWEFHKPWYYFLSTIERGLWSFCLNFLWYIFSIWHNHNIQVYSVSATLILVAGARRVCVSAGRYLYTAQHSTPGQAQWPLRHQLSSSASSAALGWPRVSPRLQQPFTVFSQYFRWSLGEPGRSDPVKTSVILTINFLQFLLRS